MVSTRSILAITCTFLTICFPGTGTIATPCNPDAKTCRYPRITVQVKTATRYWTPGFVKLSIRCSPTVWSPFLRVGVYVREGARHFGDSVFTVSLAGKKYFDTTLNMYIPPNDSSAIVIDSDCFTLDTCSNGDVDTICRGMGAEYLVFVCSQDTNKTYRELIGLPSLFNEHGDYCQLKELVWKEFDEPLQTPTSDTSASSE